MVRRLLLINFLCFLLAACASPHNLTQQEVNGLGIANIQVSFAPNAHISWSIEQEKYRETHNASPEEIRQHVKTRLLTLVQEEYDRQLKPYFQGPKKVRLEVSIRSLIVPSLAERVFVNNTASFAANYSVVDVKSGTVLARYEDTGSVQIMVGGVAGILTDATGLTGKDPALSMIPLHVAKAREWLSKGRDR